MYITDLKIRDSRFDDKLSKISNSNNHYSTNRSSLSQSFSKNITPIIQHYPYALHIEIELLAMSEQRKAVIKNADMSEDMQQDAVDCASQALSKYNIEKVSRMR